MRKNYLMLVFLCLLIKYSNAQNVKEHVSLPSPTAASLGVYGESDISMYTGAANINIPLYELKEGSLTLPISLSYNSTGVRPDAYPGWVGMNWSLNAGGSITRVVKGLPDERTALYLGDAGFHFMGYLWNFGEINGSNWSDASTITNLALDKGPDEQKIKDTEPDEFLFNVNGISGKFYLKNDLSFTELENKVFITDDIVVIGQPSVKVELEFRSECPYSNDCWLTSYRAITSEFIFRHDYFAYYISGFRVTTPDGNQYVFGGFGDYNAIHPIDFPSLETSLDFFSKGHLEETVDSWYLKQIKSPQNDIIDFEYEHGGQVVSFVNSTSIDKKFGSSDIPLDFRVIPFLIGPKENAFLANLIWGKETTSSNLSRKFSINGRIISASYLSKITTSAYEIDFSRSKSKQLTYNYGDIIYELRKRIENKEGYYAIAYWNEGWHPKFSFKYETRNKIKGLYIDADLYDDVYNVIRDDRPMNSYDWYPWPDQVVEFEYYLETIDFRKLYYAQLDNITIKSGEDKVKAYNLKYTDSTDERLRLLFVQEEGNNGLTKPPYLFEYEDYENKYTVAGRINIKTAKSRKLPGYLSGLTDHWGYYSGADDPLSPKYNMQIDMYDETTWSDYYDLKNTDEKYLYAGSLVKVIYPTKGYTKYEYEPNRYIRKVTRDNDGSFNFEGVSETIAGGLKIKNIKNYNKNGALTGEKIYEYTHGNLGVEPVYYWNDHNILCYFYDYTDRRYELSEDNYQCSRLISNSIVPVSTNGMGSHVGYSTVTERVPGNGRTIYYYTNFVHQDTFSPEEMDEGYVNTINYGKKTIYTPYASNSFRRGLLKEIRVFDENNNLLRKEKNTYNHNSTIGQNFIKAIETVAFPLPFQGSVISVEGTAYKIYTYPFNLTKKEVFEYDENGENPIITTTEFNFNDNNFLSEQKITDESGDELKTKFRYPTSLKHTNVGSAQTNDLNEARVLKKMSTDEIRMWKYPVETINYRNDKVVSAGIQTYRTKSDAVLPYRKFELETLSPLSDYRNLTHDQKTGTELELDSRHELKLIIDGYDYYGNIAQLHKPGDVNNSFVWGYNGYFPIMKAVNATSDDIANGLFENNTSGNLITPLSSAEIKEGRTACVISTSPDPQPLKKCNLDVDKAYKLSFLAWTNSDCGVRVLDQDVISGGAWKHFEFEFTGRNCIEFTNTCAGTGISTDAYVDEVRIYPVDATVSFYTYDLTKGMTSETDENDVTTYYEYDDLGRLSAVRDDDKNIIEKYNYHYDIGKIQIKRQPYSDKGNLLCNDNDVTLTIEAFNVDNYQWQKRNGLSFENVGWNSNQLSVSNLAPGDHYYRCILTNTDPEATVISSTIHLEIITNMITTQPTNVVSCNGAMFQLTTIDNCTYEWYMAAKGSALFELIPEANGSFLSAHSDPAGTRFYCKVSGICGTETSNIVEIIEPDPPVLSGGISGVNEVTCAPDQYSYSLTSPIAGCTYEWSFDFDSPGHHAVIIGSETGSTITVEFDYRPGDLPEFSGTMEVKAKDNCGNFSNVLSKSLSEASGQL